MSKGQMDARSRDLILAAEISGLLHDLGKLRPEFASEKMGEVNYRDRATELGFSDAHGAILEDPRIYPPAGQEPWLALLKQHDGWAQALCIPEEWSKPNTPTPQARGLGDPLRQHHANNKFPTDQLSLFGLLYMYGADTRDSALDKGSGGTLHGDQRVTHGFIADSFGNEREPYSPETLGKQWPEAQQIIEATLLKDDAECDLPKARQQFLDGIKDIFLYVLGETRRPTNDVTLWHHAYSTASLFKAAVAECVLRRDFACRQQDDGHFDEKRMGRVRFRLLGIRWDWAALSSGALQPVVLTALAENRQQAMKQLRQRLEVDYPIGNLVYQDDNGAVFVVGGFYQGTEDADGQQAEALFRQHILNPLQAGILQDLAPLGAGTAVRLAWTKPRLYLTDYPEVMATDSPRPLAGEGPGVRERLLQVGEDELQRLWARQTGEGQQVHICPQCGLRPGQARELAINQGGFGCG